MHYFSSFQVLNKLTAFTLLCVSLLLTAPYATAKYAGKNPSNVYNKDSFNTRDINARIDVGFSLLTTKVIEDFSAPPPEYDGIEISPLVGFAINKRTSENSTFGVKIELQQIDGSRLTSFRAIDYRYLHSQEWQFGAFIGASRYDFRTPAYGYNVGFGAFYQPKGWRRVSVGAEVQFMDKLARDKIHPDDVPATPETGPDTFTNMAGVALTMSYHF